MSGRAPPAIPPRPTGSPLAGSSPNPDAPRIPPRPAKRRTERPVSPGHDRYAPSPLNALPADAISSNLEPPQRSSNFRSPSQDEQKGMEDTDMRDQSGRGDGNQQQIQQPAQTRNVNEDLHLYAPKPSLPGSSAKAQVEVVTRTDSRQAAAAGFGNFGSPNNAEEEGVKSSLSAIHGSQREPSRERHESVDLKDEHGIPEIGQRVPMIPNAGDVQAPTPSHEAHAEHEGERHVHGPGRRDSVPPGNYGPHGHGARSSSRFEKAWYDKHPEELAREEHGQLSSPRPECAMSSDDLNKIVKSSAHKAAGLGTSTEAIGTPAEEIGYIATDELASRFASPPQGSGVREHGPQNIEVPEQPIRTPDFGGTDAQEQDHDIKETTGKCDDDEGVKIHIDEPIHQQHHPDGFMPAPEDHNPHGADLLDQQDAPILAEDEVDERTEHLQPAVSPNLEKDKRESPHVIQFPEQKSIRMTSPISDQSLTKVASRELAQSKSRAEGLESISQSVEDVDEYPPLFPNDDKLEKKISAEERFKESEQHPHRFPSQDIWEDAPDSLQLRATVSPPEGFKDETKSPQKEMAKDQQTGQFDSFTTEVSGQQNLVSTDPDAQQQSTSKDIREEAPEGQLLDTTTREPEQSDEAKSPKTDKEKQPAPEIPSRPQRQSPQISPPSQIPPASKNEPTFSPTETRKPPALPERPKPQIPPRPARPPQRTSEDSLTKVTSVGSNDSATSPILKPKPPVPSRPLGSKIAALKAGFMSDLDNRLRLGPQVPKSEEKKEEDKLEAPKGPLKDARKGRARGPVRRKPAVSSQTEEVAKLESSPTFNVTLVEPWSLWSMSPDGVLTLPREDKKMIEKPSKTEQPIEFGNAESTESNLTPEKSAIEEITVEGDRNRDLSEVKPQASVKAPSLSETLDEPAVTTIPVSDLTAAHSPPHVESEPARSTVEVPNKPAVETDLGNATSGEAEKPQTSNAEDVVREAPHRARGNDMDVEPHHDARAEQTSSPDASKESC